MILYNPSMILRHVLLVAQLILYATAQECISGPVSLPITNVSLPFNKVRRGVVVKVGTPEQSFAFLPKWDNDNTFLYGPSCEEVDLVKSSDMCGPFRGGLYDGKSGSKGEVPSSFESPSDLWNASTFNMFSDVLSFGGNKSLKGFPLANPSEVKDWDTQGYNPQNILGLGSASTLLSAVRQARYAISNSVGFWWGLDGLLDRDQMAGSIVIGGYDKAKTYGNGKTFSLSANPKCSTGMIVSIQDLTLNFVDGGDVSLFEKANGGTLLQACIIPQLPVVMNMPRIPYFTNLLDAINNTEYSRTTGVDFLNVVLDPSSTMYTGDLTINFDGGLQIRIPNHQLVVPERAFDSSGSLTVNASRPVIRINSLQSTTSQQMPVLGRYFFASAYLLYHRDANQFTLWKANPTSDENLILVNKSNSEVPAIQSCSTTTSPPPTSTPTGSQRGEVKTKPLSGGAIAGIAVGAAAVLGIVGFGLFWWRSSITKRSPGASNEGEDAATMGANYKYGGGEYLAHGHSQTISHELLAQPVEHPPTELPTSRD